MSKRQTVFYASEALRGKDGQTIDWSEVSIVIPAFNEAARVGNVVRIAGQVPARELFVVDNNSTDNTGEVARAAGARVIVCSEKGKAAAMMAGVKASDKRASIVLFCDADLTGLEPNHLKALMLPFFDGAKRPNIMTIGTFDRGRATNEMMWKTLPFLAGQRGLLKSEFWLAVKDYKVKGWEIEATLNAHFKDNKLDVMPMVLDGLFHVQKTEKLPRFGQLARISMLVIATIGYIKYPFRKLRKMLSKA